MKRNKIAILPELNNCGGDLSKKWFVFFSYRDPRNGKMKRFKVYHGLHKIKDYEERMLAGERLRADYAGKLRNGWNPFLDDEKSIYEDQLQYNHAARIYGKMRASNRTVGFYASKFISEKQTGVEIEDETLKTYRSALRIFTLWLDTQEMEQDDISVIDNGVVLQFFDFLINTQKLSAQTIKRYRQLLRSVFDLAVADKAIASTPVFNIPKCKRINDRSPRPISEFDIMDFKDAISRQDPQLWLAICFEYYCFIRPGKELRFMRIRDIDFARGTINVDAFRAKTNLDRYPTIPLVFLKELREVYKLHNMPRDYYVLGKDGVPGPKCLGKNNLRTRFREFREKLNMPDSYKLYSWKHTGNGRAIDAGITPKSLQDQNGHTSIQTTERYLRYKLGRVSPEIRNNFPPIVPLNIN